MDSQEELDDAAREGLGNEDFGAEDVAVVLTELSGAAILPRSITRASSAAQATAADLQHVRAEIHRLYVVLEEAVGVGREQGLSWPAIGWCLGVSGDAARKRYGVDE